MFQDFLNNRPTLQKKNFWWAKEKDVPFGESIRTNTIPILELWFFRPMVVCFKRQQMVQLDLEKSRLNTPGLFWIAIQCWELDNMIHDSFYSLNAVMSPSESNLIAFYANCNIWLFNCGTNTETKLTNFNKKDFQDGHSAGLPSYVMQEEFNR